MVKNNSSSRILHDTNAHIGAAKNNSSKRQYKGVRMRRWGSWVSEIRAPNQKTRIWLGSYSTPEAAARAYDAALLCIKGNSARLNFPAPPHFHLPEATMSPKSIQRVAAAAASSSSSSPPLSSSEASDDDEASRISPKEEAMVNEDFMIDPSINFEAFFQSPKCMDYVLNASAFFAPPQDEDSGEEGEIILWSFC